MLLHQPSSLWYACCLVYHVDLDYHNNNNKNQERKPSSYCHCMPAAPLSFGKDKELAGKLEVPLCLLPAKGDPGESLHEVMQTKPLGSRCVHLLPICR